MRLTVICKIKKFPKTLINKEFRNSLPNADRGTRTLTSVSPADFESAASAIPPHPHFDDEDYSNIINFIFQV